VSGVEEAVTLVHHSALSFVAGLEAAGEVDGQRCWRLTTVTIVSPAVKESAE
jgi:hypothetical protein